MTLNDLLVGGSNVLLQMQTQTENEPNDVWSGWGSVIFVSVLVVIIATVLILLIWQTFRTRQIRTQTEATIAREGAYRQLAEQVAVTQDRTANELEQLREHVSDLRNRVAKIERILAEVE